MITQLTLSQAEYEEYANRYRLPAPRYKIDDLVFLDARNLIIYRPSRKFSNKFEGPFRITAAIGKHAYRLELPSDWVGVHPVFHVSLLQPAHSDPDI